MVITYVIDKDLVMNRSKMLTVLILALFFSGEVLSQSFNFVGGGDTSNSGNSRYGNTVDVNRGDDITGGSRNSCKGNVNDYFKLDYLKGLFMTDPEDFRVTIDRNQSKVQVHVPAYITNCLDLRFSLNFEGKNDISIKAYNAEHMSSGDNMEDLAFQKYVNCLKEENIIRLKEGTEDTYIFDRKGPKVKVTTPKIIELPIPRDQLDKNKDVHAYYLSPKIPTAGSMGPIHEATEASNYGGTCYWTEHFNNTKQSLSYMSPETRAEKNVQNCLGDYQSILSALQSLNDSSLGNYAELKGILEKALIDTLDGESEAIYKKMKKLKEDVSFENGEPSLDEDEAAETLEKYADLMRDLNRKVLGPYIARVDELMTELDNTTDEAREAQIKQRIKDLKKKIKYYSDKPKSLGYNDMMKMARYYGHTSDARDIEGFRLKSLVYGSLGSKMTHPTKRKKVKVTFKSAGKIIEDAVTHFDKKIADVWETEAAVRSGDASAVRSAQNRHNALTRSRDQRYRNSMQDIQKDYKSCVGWFHTQYKIQKCQQKAQMAQKRALAQRAYYNRQIGQASTQYNHYMGIYQTYQRSLASTDGASTFDDPYGIYQDPFGNVGGLDPMNYYNMGVNNNFGGGANFNPFAGAGMGMGMNNGMGMMPGYQMMPF
jgi:cell division septum initiation protein DivIVA